MRKPSKEALRNPELFDRRTREVEYFVSKTPEYGTRNCFYQDEETGEVFDKFITVRDPRDGLGLPRAVKRKASFRPFWKKALRGLGAVFLASKAEIPVAVANALFKASSKEARKAEVAVKAFQLADDGDLESAIFLVLDHFEADDIADILEAWGDPSTRKQARGELLLRLSELLD